MKTRRIPVATTLAASLLALTLIAPWALAQDPDPITELRRLAEQGHAEAQFELGVRHTIGLRLPQDDTEAVRWFRLAADQGHAEAQVVLAGRYALGLGVLKDEAEAERWFRLAAEQGDPEAQFNLGYMYQPRGVPDPQDAAEAVRWYRLAAEQGHARALYNLGNMYAPRRYFESGVPPDASESTRWYRLAAEQFHLAAEQGHPEAQFTLGAMYAYGEGVSKDSVLAHMWFNIAGANGNKQVRTNRDLIEDEMTRAEITRAIELARTCMASDYRNCEP